MGPDRASRRRHPEDMGGNDDAQTKPSCILVLQGGGAMGAYHIGACEALQEYASEPNWICGISMGAINGAIIAGNTSER